MVLTAGEPALVLCGLAAIGLISVGALALISPARLSRSYGVPAEERSSFVYVRATGARDLLLGLIFFGASYRGDPLALLVLCTLGLVLSFTDFALAFSFSRAFRGEHLAHLGGAAGFAVIIGVLIHSMRP